MTGWAKRTANMLVGPFCRVTAYLRLTHEDRAYNAAEEGEVPRPRLASECIWYVLATVAGEPEKSRNPGETARQNASYWNAIMADRLGGQIRNLNDLIGSSLPALTVEYQTDIKTALQHRGFGDSPIPEANVPIDFSNVNFNERTRFEGFVFDGSTSFEEARFNGSLHSFENAIFINGTQFRGADFLGPFYGLGMRFVGAGSAVFERATFRTEATFSHSQFQWDALFEGARFSEDARFDHCEFASRADFADADFQQEVEFSSAKFLDRAQFQQAKFQTSVPNFFEAELAEYIEWHNAEWPKKTDGLEEALDHIQRYQRLARLMIGLEKFDDQRFFERQEMRVRRATQRWGPVRCMNIAYQYICGYGYGLKRAIAWWLGNIVGGAVLLCLLKTLQLAKDDPVPRAAAEAFAEFPRAFRLSLGNAHGFLDLNNRFLGIKAEDLIKEWPCYGQVGITQTFLGVIFLFFLLLTVRNLFRMR